MLVSMATSKPTGTRECLLTLPQLHLQTQVATEASWTFGLCGFSWHLPRDTKIVMHMVDISCLSQLSSIVHTGTNQKAQQSCASVLDEECAAFPGFPGTLKYVYQTCMADNTQLIALNTV